MTREGNRREGKASRLHAPCAFSSRICPFTCIFCLSLETRLFNHPKFDCTSVDMTDGIVSLPDWNDAIDDAAVP